MTPTPNDPNVTVRSKNAHAPAVGPPRVAAATEQVATVRVPLTAREARHAVALGEQQPLQRAQRHALAAQLLEALRREIFSHRPVMEAHAAVRGKGEQGPLE